MSFTRLFFAAALSALILTAPATASHGHLTLTQQAGQLVIAPYSSEPQNTIAGGQVFHHGQPMRFTLETPAAGGTFDGFLQGATFSLTSDAFAATLGAGDYYYEVQITAPDGSPTGAALGHGTEHSEALSTAPTRLARSLHVAVTDFGGGLVIGSHPHGQMSFVDTPGQYRMVLIAWDKLYEDSAGAAGYADSQPVYFLINVVAPLPGDLNADGFVGIEDLNLVLGNWNQSVAAGDPLRGDPSGDGFVGIEDLNAVLGNWNAGTPPGSTGLIPEPASGLMLAAVMFAFGGARRRWYGRRSA